MPMGSQVTLPTPPNILNKPQLSEYLGPPLVYSEPHITAPVTMGQEVIGSGGTGKPVTPNHDNDPPAGPDLISTGCEEGEEAPQPQTCVKSEILRWVQLNWTC